MALAHLKYRRLSGNDYFFVADTGTNAFFQFKIGKEKRRFRGIPVLDEVVFESPVLSVPRMPNQVLRTDFPLKIPGNLFSNEAKYIQLWSFKNERGQSPAISSAVLVNPTFGRHHFEPLPNLNLSLSTVNMETIDVKNKPFDYREVPVSESMFWGALLGALPTVVSAAAPLLQNLLGGSSSGSNNSTPAATPAPSGGNSAELVQTIADAVIQVIGNNSGGTPAAATTPATTPSPEAAAVAASQSRALNAFASRMFSEEALQELRSNPEKLYKNLNDSALRISKNQRVAFDNYSEAKIAPAAIAALAPVVKEILELGLKGDQENNRHLEALLGALNDPSILPILQSVSQSMSSIPEISYKFDNKFKLEFSQLHFQELDGKKKSLYAPNRSLYFPIKITTDHPNPPNRPFPKAIIQLVVQDSDSMEVLLRKNFKFKDIFLNTLIKDVYLTPNETTHFPKNKDLKIELSFIWQSPRNKANRGVLKNHLFCLTDDYIFDRIGDKVGADIPLNDIVQHRPFWHKVWEGGFTNSQRWEVDFDVKYYYALNLEEVGLSKLETRKINVEDNATSENPEPPRRKVRAKLKSGLELSLEALNKLMPTLSQTSLSEDILKKLKSAALEKYFNQVARVGVELKGRSGDTGALWTYPEISLHNFHFKKVEEVNDLGQIIKLGEEIVVFPRPVSIHFIGTKST